jgi:DNA-binding response OmpR family regulator
MKVLVIEDSPDTGFLIKTMLMKKYEAEVDIAPDCEAARAYLGSGPYDLVTLDYHLPDCDGLEMLDEITSVEGHPPVVMITGQGDEELAYLSFRMGASGYAAKDRHLSVMLAEAVEWALADAAEKNSVRKLRESIEAGRKEASELMGSLKAALGRAEEAGKKLAEGESGASGELAGELALAKQQVDDLVTLMRSGHQTTSASPDAPGELRPGPAPEPESPES